MATLQKIQPTQTNQLLVTHPHPSEVHRVKKAADIPFHRDSISSSRDLPSRYQPSKPNLSAGRLETRILSVADTSYNAGIRALNAHLDETSLKQEELKALSTEQIKRLEEVAKKTQDGTFWGVLAKVGHAILGVASTFLGFAILGTGAAPFVAGAMIACGILSLANLALTEAGLWDWAIDLLVKENEELNRKLKTLVPTIVGLAVCGGNLAIAVFGGGAVIWGSLELAPRIIGIAQALASFLAITSAVGKEVTEANIALAESHLTEVKGKLALHQYSWEDTLRYIKEIAEPLTQTIDQARKILALYTQRYESILA